MRTEIKAALVLGLFGILGMVIWGINSGRQGSVELPMDVGKEGGKTTRLASDSGGRQGTQPLSRDLANDGGRGAPGRTTRTDRSAGNRTESADRTGRRPEPTAAPSNQNPAPTVATPPRDGRDAAGGRDVDGGRRETGGSDAARLARGGDETLPPQDTSGGSNPGLQSGSPRGSDPPLAERDSSLSSRTERSPVMGPEAVPSSRDGSPAPTDIATPDPATRAPHSGRPIEEQPLRPERGGAANIGDLPRSPASGSETSHTIQLGETLISIAREKYGADKYWQQIQAANPGLDPSRLLPGTVIKLPSADEIRKATPDPKPAVTESRPATPPAGGNDAKVRRATYKVADGDTLISIARNVLKDASRWPEIYALNRDKLASPDHIIEGMLLKIPE